MKKENDDSLTLPTFSYLLPLIDYNTIHRRIAFSALPTVRSPLIVRATTSKIDISSSDLQVKNTP
jgi:hypothetical protein